MRNRSARKAGTRLQLSRTAGFGTTGSRRSISAARIASAAATQNSDGTPKRDAMSGPRIIASMNDVPIPTPKTAMLRVRTSARVASVIRAVSVAEIAPAPCSRRPAITP